MPALCAKELFFIYLYFFMYRYIKKLLKSINNYIIALSLKYYNKYGKTL